MASSPDISVAMGPDGVWFCRPYLGRNKVTGRALRPYKSFPSARSESEALVLAREWAATIAPATGLSVGNRTDELLRRYVDVREATDLAGSSAKTYRSLIDTCIPQGIGQVSPADVTPSEISALYADLLRGNAGGEPLSRAYVRKLHFMLSGAWRWFIANGICAANPLDGVEPPVPEPGAARALEGAALTRLVGMLLSYLSVLPMRSEEDAAQDVLARSCALAAWIQLHTGCRPGEACAMRFCDFVRGRMSARIGGTVVEAGGVHRQAFTKSKKVRNVAIDDELLSMVDAQWRWMSDWLTPFGCAPGAETPVCVVASGGILRPSVYTRTFRQMCATAGLPAWVHPHTLRHTHATWLIAEGVDARTVQERLGHADVATTLRVYSHVLPGRDEAASAAFTGMVDRLKGGDPWERT